MSNWVDFLPLLFLVVIFWLLIIRPARARQRAFLKTQSELKVGDKIMLASGIVSVSDETLELRIAPDTVVTVSRQAVGRVVRDTTSDHDA